MGGDMHTIVVYNPATETEESLEKIKNIFFLAEYKEQLVLQSIDDLGDFSILLNYQGVFCSKETYDIISHYYVESCSVPSFELSLGQYYDKKSQFLLYSFPYSFKDSYLTENKKQTWKLVQSFVKQFNNLIKKDPPIFVATPYIPQIKEVITEVVQEIIEEIAPAIESVTASTLETETFTPNYASLPYSVGPSNFNLTLPQNPLVDIVSTLRELANHIEKLSGVKGL